MNEDLSVDALLQRSSQRVQALRDALHVLPVTLRRPFADVLESHRTLWQALQRERRGRAAAEERLKSLEEELDAVDKALAEWGKSIVPQVPVT